MIEKTLDDIKLLARVRRKPMFEDDAVVEVIKNIGRKISESRRSLQLTQGEFAKRCGTSIQMVQYWESGQNLTLKTLIRISGSLHCGIADLLEKPNEGTPSKRGRPPAFNGK